MVTEIRQTSVVEPGSSEALTDGELETLDRLLAKMDVKGPPARELAAVIDVTPEPSQGGSKAPA